MQNKTFNIYCDESCHLEHDHNPYMFLGAVSCAYSRIQKYTKEIQNLKKKHNFYAEIKWSHVSKSKLDFYLELVDLFFENKLYFRAIGIDKSKILCGEFDSDYDDFYYKMYYQLLNYKINTLYKYNVYLDIKDTLSAYKVRKLKDILNIKYGTFQKIQNIRSEESVLMQLSDFLMGAISYNVNNKEKNNTAKVQIIEKLKKLSHDSNLGETNYSNKFNLFFINLKK